jgi:hypothetical protein
MPLLIYVHRLYSNSVYYVIMTPDITPLNPGGYYMYHLL